MLHVTDPELIKIILVEEFNRFNNRRELNTYNKIINKNLFDSRDEQWKKIRTITGYAFNRVKIKKLYGSVKVCVDEYLELLDKLCEEKNSLNVKSLFDQFSLDVITYCAFATKVNSIKDPYNPFILNCQNIFKMKTLKIIPAFAFPKWLNRILAIKTFLDEDSSDYIIEFFRNIIEKRKQIEVKNNDFLQLLIDAKVEDTKYSPSFNTGILKMNI